MPNTPVVIGCVISHFALGLALWRCRRALVAARLAADRDSLTGLLNRRAAERLFTRWQRQQRRTAVVLIDLDRFKAVNDTYGHLAGDRVLAVVGARLRTRAHRHGGDACRLGGDELLVLLPVSTPDEHRRQVEAILADIAEPILAPVRDAVTVLRISGTAGVAVSLTAQDWTGLLGTADQALYDARRAGLLWKLHRPEPSRRWAAATGGPSTSGAEAGTARRDRRARSRDAFEAKVLNHLAR